MYLELIEMNQGPGEGITEKEVKALYAFQLAPLIYSSNISPHTIVI